MGRAPCCDKTKVKRGPWSPQEDNTLKNFLQTYGTGGNWISLPQKAGLNRCGKSCRLRWLNYLRPDIKHGNFTDEEDTTILTLYHNIGSRWSVIASHLPGRTDNDVKNYWNTKLKKKFFASANMSASSISTSSAMTSNNTFHERTYYENFSNAADHSRLVPDMVAAPSQLPGLTEFPRNVDQLNAYTSNGGYASSHSTSSASIDNTGSSNDVMEFGSMLMSLDHLLMSDYDFQESNQSLALLNFEMDDISYTSSYC